MKILSVRVSQDGGMKKYEVGEKNVTKIGVDGDMVVVTFNERWVRIIRTDYYVAEGDNRAPY